MVINLHMEKEQIRTIKLSDYQSLIEFWKMHYFVNEMDGYDRFRLFLKKNPNLSILIEDNGKIVGTVLGSFDGRRGYIQKLVVNKSYRKKGLGKKLIDTVVKKLEALGALYIPISCEIGNTPFFGKSGFKKTDQVTMSISHSTYSYKKSSDKIKA